MSVTVPINDAGNTDTYIDDTAPVCVDIDDNANAECCGAASALAFNILSQHLDTNEPIPCEVMLPLAKLMDEGWFQEINTALGWILDTMWLLMYLSSDRSAIWSADIQRHILHGSLLASELETMVVRLDHV
jgi:hypothetical protein